MLSNYYIAEVAPIGGDAPAVRFSLSRLQKRQQVPFNVD
jgi:hypothetical protein